MVICLKRGADLHMAQLMPRPLTVSRFSKIQTDFTFLVSVYTSSPGKRAVTWECVCVSSLMYAKIQRRQVNVLHPSCAWPPWWLLQQ